MRLNKILIQILLLLYSVFISNIIFAQDRVEDLEEIAVFLNLPRVGSTEVSALVNERDIYLSVNEVFRFLKIKVDYTPGFDTISGYIVNQQLTYLILREKRQIIYQGKTVDLERSSLLRTETNLYLKSSYFNSIFGLEFSFNFRSLSVTLNSKIELPIIRELRLEQMRKNIQKISGEIVADTTFKNDFSFLKIGTADWNIQSVQNIGQGVSTRANLALGAALLGGEAELVLNYQSGEPIAMRNQQYRWRYANNDNRLIKQIQLGKMSVNPIKTLYSPVIGFQLTNTPTTYRQSFGTYQISDFTEPDWTVELYVNNVLIDYKKSDASGFFTFDVPLIYGNTDIKLQFYGPWGEERSMEKSIDVPFMFLPKGLLEYKIVGGITEDSLKNIYSKAELEYGLNRSVTLGVGAEFIRDSSNYFVPFVSTSAKLLPSMFLTANYAFKTRLITALNYRFAKNYFIEALFSLYDKNQTIISTNNIQERRLSLSFPITGKSLMLFTRIGFGQTINPSTTNNIAEVMISGVYKSVNANLTTQAFFSRASDLSVSSNLSIGLRLPLGIMFRPSAQYSFTNKTFLNAKTSLEMNVMGRGFLNLSYERNFITNSSTIDLGLRIDLSFARLFASARKIGNSYMVTENLSGSFIADPSTKYFKATNRNSVGRAALVLEPFLDINSNGKKDSNERRIGGLRINVNGGKVDIDDKDTLVYVTELEPYNDLLLNLDATSFDNLSWQLPFKTISVTTEPNKVKRLELPVSVISEVSGFVNIKYKSGDEGLGRVTIIIRDGRGKIIKNLLTEPDGYYNFLGLKPGDYSIELDPQQLATIKMSSDGMSQIINVSPTEDGEMIEGINFYLVKEFDSTAKSKEISESLPLPVIQPASEYYASNPVYKPEKSVTKQPQIVGFRVQIYAFNVPMRDKEVLAKIMRFVPDLKIEEIKYPDGVYRYVSQSFANRAEAQKIIGSLRRIGYKDTFIRED